MSTIFTVSAEYKFGSLITSSKQAGTQKQFYTSMNTGSSAWLRISLSFFHATSFHDLKYFVRVDIKSYLLLLLLYCLEDLILC
jgi:hypothetical protein